MAGLKTDPPVEWGGHSPVRRGGPGRWFQAALGRSPHVDVRAYRLRTPVWPAGAPGLRIAHVTDLHVGRVTPEARLEAAVEAVNESGAALVALTGDYVAHSLRYLPRLTHALKALKIPAFATLGNHDHWHGADAVTRALERAGVEVLCNTNRVFTAGLGAGLGAVSIVGIDDAVTGHHDIERAFAGAQAGPTVVLSHLAEITSRFQDRGVPLVLSGHTHGGQIRTAGVMERVMRRMGHQYILGWYTLDSTAIYVNPGIGAAVIPWRTRHAHAEVAVIDIEASAAPLDVEIVDGRTLFSQFA